MNQSDPFSKARPSSKVTTNEMPQPTETKDPFVKARPKSPDESMLESLGRHTLRIGSRAAETFLGAPGDLLNLAEKATLGGIENVTGADLSKFRKGIQETAPFKLLPTSQDLRQVQSEVTGGYTEPKKDTWEEDVDNVTRMATALGTGGSSFMRSVGSALAGSGAGKVAESLGFGDNVKLASEVGTMFLFHNLNPGQADKFVENSYNAAREAVPKGTMVPTSSYTKALDALEDTLAKGAPTATKEAVMKSLKHMRNRAAGGAIELNDLEQAYRDINQNLNSKGLFDNLGSSERKIARRQFEELKDVLRNEFESYGRYNPEFIENWRAGNAGYAGIQKSKSIREWIRSIIKHIPEKLVGAAAVEALAGYPELAVGTLGGGAAAATALRTFETVNRFVKSRILRKAYLEAIKNAAASNVPATVKSLERLDELDKKESKKAMLHNLDNLGQNK